jgi:RNA polymerase sigma-70 factor (ECF subfamily)
LDALLAQRAWVRSLARHLVADADRADEIEQRTWLAALERPPAHAGSPRGWLATALRNAARKLGRADARRARHESVAPVREPQRSPDELVAETELQQLVGRLVLELEEPYRETVLFRYVEGLEHAEIARRQGVAPATVRVRLHRAIARLRERLDGEHRGNRAAWTSAVLLWFGDARPRQLGAPAAASAAGGLAMAGLKKTVAAVVVIALLVGGGVVALRTMESDHGRDVAGVSSQAVVNTAVQKRARAEEQTGISADASAPVDLELLDRERDLGGVVVRADGTPVAGAEVRSVLYPKQIVDLGQPEWYREEAPGPATRTAADGTFRLRLAPGAVVTLRVRAEGLPPREFSRRNAGARVRLVLDAGVRLRLLAVSASGAPVVGVRLGVATGAAKGGGTARSEVTTDAEGKAVVDGVAGGQSAFVQTLDARQGANTFWKLPLPESGEVEHRLEFLPYRALRGRVTDAATGLAIAGARVGMVSTLDHAVTTATDGSYELPGWTGVLASRVAFSADRFMRYETDVGGRVTIDVSLHRGFAVRGRVVAADGSAIAGALVAAAAVRDRRAQESMTLAHAVSGPDGRFRLDGLDPDMSHRLVAAVPGRARSVSSVAARPAGETVDVGDIVLGAAHIVAGRLVDADARGIEGATVELRGPGDQDQWDSTATGLRAFRRTDDLGRFRFDDLPPGPYVLEAYDFPGPKYSTSVTVPGEGDAADVVLRGDPALTLAVRVRDEGGRPVAGAEVNAWGEGASAPRAETDANGEARLLLATAVRWVSVRRDGLTTRAFLPTTLEVREGTSEMAVVLREGASIRVRLLGPDDVPIAHAAISAMYGRAGWGHGVTDELGRSTLVLPMAPAYDIAYESKETGLYAVARGVTNGADVTLRAAQPARDRSLRVRLLRPDGTPAPDEPVSVRAPPAGRDDKTAQTDAAGIAVFEGLPARELIVVSWMGTYAPASELRVVPEGQTVELRQRPWVVIRGRCLDASGSPVAASVAIEDRDTGRTILGAPGAESSAANGAFEILLPEGEPGPFRLSAATGKPPRYAHLDDVTPGATDLVLRFDK